MPMTILAVDDEPDIAELARFHLASAGYAVVTASSGRAALEAIHFRRPDLVVLDLMLPDIDGFGLCEILRHDPTLASIPIIILSAWSTREARALGFDFGVLAYLTKPFSPSDLVAQVNRLLRLAPPPGCGPSKAA